MLWVVTMNDEGMKSTDRLSDSDPQRYEWVNRRETGDVIGEMITAYPDNESWEMPSMVFSRSPAPKLRVSHPGFRLDFFTHQLFQIASAKLRRTFGLDERTIRYREVDTSLSDPAVQALGYAAFDVIPYGNPFDPQRMAGAERDVRYSDGSLRREWVPFPPARPVTGAYELHLRSDFIPPAPLFRSVGASLVFATDDFAERIAASGVTGMGFYDITGPQQPERERFR